MISPEEAKAHCRFATDDDHFDGELQISIDASVGHLKSIDIDMDADPLPPALKQAVLLLVAHFMDNKEAVTRDGPTHVTPFGVARLVAPYRKVTL